MKAGSPSQVRECSGYLIDGEASPTARLNSLKQINYVELDSKLIQVFLNCTQQRRRYLLTECCQCRMDKKYEESPMLN